MSQDELLKRINIDPNVCGGQACIRGTRIMVSILLGSLAEGMTSEEILDHYPHLTVEDIQASLAYGAALAQENVWKIAI